MVNAGTGRCLAGCFCWIHSDIKNAVCSTNVGTATNRDEVNVLQLLRYFVGSPLCHRIDGCALDVPGAAGTPLGSVSVMTDADWAGDVKHLGSYSGVAVWVKDRTMKTWYPLYASFKKRNMIFLSSGGIRCDGSGGWRV